jgi:U3 small nucleolar RNA-associated protein 12
VGLTLALVRQQELTSPATAVAVSPNSQMVAVGLLDADGTVEVYYLDSLKFRHKLYGGSMPVNDLCFSFDSALIATAGRDRKVKVWGAAFGDCHRAIRAHASEITRVAFVADTHYLWSASRDGSVKLWDGDNWQMIQEFSADTAAGALSLSPLNEDDCPHLSQVWALAVAPSGRFAITAGQDRSLRIWEQTDEPLYLESEQEHRQIALIDRQAAADAEARALQAEGGETGGVAANALSRTRVAEAVERVAEAIETARLDIARRHGTCEAVREDFAGLAEADVPPALVETRPAPTELQSPLMLDLLPDPYLLRHLREWTAATIVLDVAANLTTSDAQFLMAWCTRLLAVDVETEFAARMLLFLIRRHFGTLTHAGAALRPHLAHYSAVAEQRLAKLESGTGTSLAALKLMADRLEAHRKGRGTFFGDAADLASASSAKRTRQALDALRKRAIAAEAL